MTHKAQLRHLHIAPRKVRRIANTLKRLPVHEAEAQLMVRSQRPAEPLLKLIRSAAAGAVQKKANRDALMIGEIRVDQGPMLKRSLPRAQGRATAIHKITSHVTVILHETEKPQSSRFVFPKKETKKKKEEKKKHKHTKDEKPKTDDKEVRAVKGKEERQSPGFFKKVFRRQSV